MRTLAIMLTLFSAPTLAASLEPCGTVAEVKGESCKDSSVRFDLSKCGEQESIVIAKVTCDASGKNEFTATHRGPKYNYRAVFEQSSSGWGKVGYELKGKLWRHMRAPTVAAVSTPVQPETKEIPREPAGLGAPVVVAPPAPPTKVSEEDITKVVNMFSGFNVKGSADAYYAYNFNTPALTPATPTATNAQTQNKYHVFDAYHDDLQFAFAHLQIQKTTGAVTTTLDVGYGPAMQTISGTKTDAGQFNAKQVYATYKANDKLTIDVGRFATHLGYEVIESQDNWNYSRSLLFGYFVPFWHQGAKASYAINDKLTVMALVSDGWNNSYTDTKQKSYGGQIAWVPNESVAFYLNGITGSTTVPTNLDAAAPMKARTVYDFISTYKATSKLTFALNADLYQIGNFSASGVAGYAHYQFDDQWAITPRIEFINDRDNLALSETLSSGQEMSSFTLTLENRLAPNLLLRLEGRRDQSTQEVFTREGSPTNSQTLGTLSVTTSF